MSRQFSRRPRHPCPAGIAAESRAHASSRGCALEEILEFRIAPHVRVLGLPERKEVAREAFLQHGLQTCERRVRVETRRLPAQEIVAAQLVLGCFYQRQQFRPARGIAVHARVREIGFTIVGHARGERLAHTAHRECARGAGSVAFVRDASTVPASLALAGVNK